jgi:hypothetical protein
MTDYIAEYTDENDERKIIDINQYKENYLNKNIKCPFKLQCHCGGEVRYRSASRDVVGLITKIDCFFHMKGANCNLPTITLSSNTKKIIKSMTDEEKYYERLKLLCKLHLKHLNNLKDFNQRIRDCLKQLKPYENKIKDTSFITDDIKLLSYTKIIFIDFRKLDEYTLNSKICYQINNIDLKDENFYKFLTKIANDFSLYIIYVRQISLTLLYYSRCYANIENMEITVLYFEEKTIEAIKQAKMFMFIEDD